MGFIKAFKGALGGTFADQWLDFIRPRTDVTATSLVFGGVAQGKNKGRGENTKGSNEVISNGSKILVPEGTALITMQDGEITGCILEPGGYTYTSDDINAKSFFGGDGIIESTISQSWDRFKRGGQASSAHTVFYVNLKEIPNNRFGTQSEIYWDDMYIGAQVGAMARGSYTLRVVDPLLLVKQFVPVQYLGSNSPIFDLADMENDASEQLFNEVVGSLASAFSMYSNDPDKGNRMSKIQADQVGFAQSLTQVVENNYGWKTSRGLIIEKVAIVAIEYDADTKELLSKVKTSDALMGARGASFAQHEVAQGVRAAGENGGGTGMAFMGMGMNAANNMMGQMNNQQMQYQQMQQQQNQQLFQQNQQQAAQPQQAAQQAEQPQQVAQEDPYAKLKSLKELLDAGVITQEEFDAAKAKVLDL